MTKINTSSHKNLINYYDPAIINETPMSSIMLYNYYYDHTKYLIDYVESEFNEVPYVLNNEIRAMFGHLSKHSTRFDLSNFELKKAYGHFRRLNLDAFKLLCNEYDIFFSSFLNKSYKYSFKKIDKDFILNYATAYYLARKKYLDAQNCESVGSNSDENVYKAYLEAFQKYMELKEIHMNKIKDINEIIIKTRIVKFISVAWIIIMTIATIIPFF